MTPTKLITLAEAIYGPELGDDWKSCVEFQVFVQGVERAGRCRADVNRPAEILEIRRTLSKTLASGTLTYRPKSLQPRLNMTSRTWSPPTLWRLSNQPGRALRLAPFLWRFAE